MATNVIMPSLGFDMTQGKVARWLKKEGDAVTKGQAVAEVETEKATVEIEAFEPGILHKILVQPGETVPVGTPIAIIADPGEKVESGPPPAPTPQAAQKTSTSSNTTATPAKTTGTGEDGRIKASPIARKMAEQAGLDLGQLTGSGPGRRIMEADVQAAIAALTPGPAPAGRGEQAAPSPLKVAAPPKVEGPPQPTAPAGELPLSRMRQTIAQRMTQSKTTAPHFYVTVQVNMAEALKVREQLNNVAAESDKFSINDLVVSAVAHTLSKFNRFNASFNGDRLTMHSNINIGIAVAVEDGLLTPVLHDADKKPLRQIAAETKGMAERAHANKMRPEDLGPGTFTVSNLGMFGVDEFSAIINPPEAAILAIGGVTKRPVVINDEIKIAPMMHVTLSVDHRVADGAQAGRFLQELKKLLENPLNLLLT